MLPIEVITTFFGAAVLLALAPGPDNIFVLTQSALQGRRAGICVVFGLCTGLVGHSTAVALGVSVIFKTSFLAFTILKYIGTGYLLYLAYQALRASALKIEGEKSKELSYSKLYRRGIIMNITNPKVSLFFLAFLPQFIDPARGSVTAQTFMLGGLFIIATILVFGTIAILAGNLGEWLIKSERAQKIMNKLAGSVFIALALKLAFEKQID